ncbi:MAG: PEP-CTERM sorting domain-containing protein [Bryobacterales bacterium]|nr:PEP-CTERM sorting domain-containing protein [Bryobacterales bacterium]
MSTTPSAVPEPATTALVPLVLLALAASRRYGRSTR